MLSRQIMMFIKCAETGSFNKAGEEMFISGNAIIKQINLLEDEIGFKLFDRTHQGIVLTHAGRCFYKDCKYMTSYYKDSIKRAKAMIDEDLLIRIGTSLTTPTSFLLDLWPEINLRQEQLQFELVSFENSLQNAKDIMKNFGQLIDCVLGIYNDNLLIKRECQALKLYDTPLCAYVPINHPYANKVILNIEDLRDENILLIEENYLDTYDKVRKEFHHVKDVSFFDIHVFNECARNNSIFIGVKEWSSIHPLLKMVPVDWNYKIPYGIMYSKSPSLKMEILIGILKDILSSNL